MPRIARVVIPGCPHHVTQRGNHRRRVYFEDRDYEFYLMLLGKYFPKYQVAMPGYSLLPNHSHEALIPAFTYSLAKGVGRLHNDFSKRQQDRLNITGHLYQNRFYSTPMDEEHFWMALRYIELNPVRAGLVRNAWDWPWSSARAHVTGHDETGLLTMDLWAARFDGRSWKRFLEQGLGLEREFDLIRAATRTGRPLGSDAFVRFSEVITGRRLRPQKRGPEKGARKKRGP